MTAGALYGRTQAWIADFKADPKRVRFMHNAVFWTVVAWAAAHMGMAVLRAHYRLGLDLEDVRCMPWVAYIIKLGPIENIKHGDYIAIRDADGLLGPKFKDQLLGKQVTGMPGDRIVVKNDFLWINGKPIGALILNAKLGKGAGAFDRDEVVPPGKLFLTGTEPRSYDSRYVGFFDPKHIVGSVSPVF